MRSRILALCAASCLAGGALSAQEPTPDAVITSAVSSLISNDLTAMLSFLPADKLAEMKANWDAYRAVTPENPNEDMQMNMVLGMLSMPGSADLLFAQAEPGLAQIKPQEMAGQVGIGMMMLGMQLGGYPDVAQAGEVKTVMEILPLLQAWLPNAGINDPVKLKAALVAFTEAFQKLELRSATDLRALTFEQLLAKIGGVIGALKGGLAPYDVDVDSFLKSVKVTKAGVEGDLYSVSTSFEMFSKTLNTVSNFKMIDGKWTSTTVAAVQAMIAKQSGGNEMPEGAVEEEAAPAEPAPAPAAVP